MPRRISDLNPQKERKAKVVDEAAFSKDIGDSWSEVDQTGTIEMEEVAEMDKAIEMKDEAEEFEEGAMFRPVKRSFSTKNDPE